MAQTLKLVLGFNLEIFKLSNSRLLVLGVGLSFRVSQFQLLDFTTSQESNIRIFFSTCSHGKIEFACQPCQRHVRDTSSESRARRLQDLHRARSPEGRRSSSFPGQSRSSPISSLEGRLQQRHVRVCGLYGDLANHTLGWYTSGEPGNKMAEPQNCRICRVGQG